MLSRVKKRPTAKHDGKGIVRPTAVELHFQLLQLSELSQGLFATEEDEITENTEGPGI